jgi:hypothetical protein
MTSRMSQGRICWCAPASLDIDLAASKPPGPVASAYTGGVSLSRGIGLNARTVASNAVRPNASTVSAVVP